MATIHYKVFKHHKKNDGTYNVKYCLTHKGKQIYHASSHFAKQSDLKRDLTLRQGALFDLVYEQEKVYRERISRLGASVDLMDEKEILQRITAEARVAAIDFVSFGIKYIKGLLAAKKHGSAGAIRPALNNLIDFMQSDYIPIESITANILRKFEIYLTTDRVQVRVNQFGKMISREVPGMTKAGVHATMRDLRIIFNAARAEYNTEFHTAIVHYPFAHYKVPKPPAPKKRGGIMDVRNVINLRDFMADQGSLAELGRDMYMLSFFLCGMNAKDILEQDWHIKGGRLDYARSKTKGRRGDEAFISIKVPLEALATIKRYKNNVLQKRYSSYGNFIRAINKGLASIPNDVIPEGVTFYYARHTFATLAHNKCGMSEEDIATALNHVDQSRKVTKGYIDHDWSRVDAVQGAILEYVQIASKIFDLSGIFYRMLLSMNPSDFRQL